MEEMQVDCEYISGSANSLPNCIQWINAGSESLVVFGMKNLIAIADATNERIVCTLKGHGGTVNSIFCLTTMNYVLVFSTSDDKTVRCWYHIYSDEIHVWHQLFTLADFEGSGMCISSCFLDSNTTLLFGFDSIGNVLSWSFQFDGISLSNIKIVSRLRFPPSQLPRCMAICSFNDDIMLFLGTVDTKTHIYFCSCRDVIESMSNDCDISILTPGGVLSGHEEWITSISILNKKSEILVATSSQDSKVRLWRLVRSSISQSDLAISSSSTKIFLELEDQQDGDAEESIDVEEGTMELDNEAIESEARLVFLTKSSSWSVYLDALLVGHEDWVTSVTFFPTNSDSVMLFSTSMDRNFILWAQDSSGVWQSSIRMGDIGGTLGGSVGGNLLGFVSGCINPEGNQVLGIGYGGSFHLWHLDKDSSRWHPKPFLTGHFSSVNDLMWEPHDGRYLLSASSDQTCRLFAPIHSSNSFLNQKWREISRPLIHGYDLTALTILQDSHSLRIICGGEEKIIRVFEAPTIVLDGLQELCGINFDSSFQQNHKIFRAYIPELGLSNKAAELMSTQEQKELDARGVTPITWKEPPLEGQLADFSIWPETRKLFGHNYDITCMDLSPDRGLLASACKARDEKAANILIWNTERMVPIGSLVGHESSIVSLRFSPNGKYLVSAGKDRSIGLFVRGYQSENQSYSSEFISTLLVKSAHKRIIWDCCWSPDSRYLVTVSRDGMCKIWLMKSDNDVTRVSINAVDIDPSFCNEDLLWIVFGSEHGDIHAWSINIKDLELSHRVLQVPKQYSHGSVVKRLRTSNGRFASGGDDNTVRIFRIVDHK